MQEKKETLLIESEKKYKLLYETSKDAIMTLEPPNWNFTSGNPSTIKLFNCKNEKDFISKNPGQLSPKFQPDKQLSSDKAKGMIEKAMKEGSNFFEWTHKKATGENFPATVLLTKIEIKKGKPFLQATVRDISKEKNVGEKLKELQKESEDILNSLTVGVLGADPKTKKFIFSNKKIYEMLGYSKEEILNLSVDKIHPKKDLPHAIKQFELQMKGKLEIAQGLPVLRRDGKIIFCDITSRPRKINGKEILLGVFEDVTKKKQTEEKFKLLFNQSPDGIILFDPKTKKIIEFNKKAHEQLGYTRKEFENIKVQDFEAKETPEQVKKHIETQIKQGGETFETKHKKKNGEIIDILVTSKLIKNQKSILALGIFRDITMQKKAKNETEKFNEFAIDRELKMIELKKEVNSLLKQLNKQEKYKIN